MAIDSANNRSSIVVMVIAIAALLAIVAYALVIVPEHRTPGEKVTDALYSVKDGFKDAGRSLQNRTPAEKAGDALEDAGEKLKRSSN